AGVFTERLLVYGPQRGSLPRRKRDPTSEEKSDECLDEQGAGAHWRSLTTIYARSAGQAAFFAKILRWSYDAGLKVPVFRATDPLCRAAFTEPRGSDVIDVPPLETLR